MANMVKFWVVGTSTQLNNLNHRFYTYEEAQDEALAKTALNPKEVYLVLELVGYAEGQSNVETSFIEVEGDNI